MSFFEDYEDAIEIIIPMFIIEKNIEVQQKLKELKEILIDLNNYHPYVSNSIYEIKHYKEKIKLFKDRKNAEIQENIEREEKLQNLLNKNIIEICWEPLTYWIGIDQSDIIDINGKTICSEADFTKKGNIKSDARKYIENYFAENLDDFSKANIAEEYFDLYKNGLIRNMKLTFGYFAVGIRFERKYIREYHKRKDYSIFFKKVPIEFKNGKIKYPFDITKYQWDEENQHWFLQKKLKKTQERAIKEVRDA